MLQHERSIRSRAHHACDLDLAAARVFDALQRTGAIGTPRVAAALLNSRPVGVLQKKRYPELRAWLEFL
jgi:hypothetical protein